MFNRRAFLVRTISLAALPRTLTAMASPLAEPAASTEFSTRDLATLAAAMDGIIPPGDGMPSASAVGGVQYLQNLGWQYPKIQQEISSFLKLLAQGSVAEFSKLRPAQRAQVLAALEKTDASAFSNFVSYVYESYYANPRIFGLICCAPSALPSGDDEELLAPVRKMKQPYREIP